MAVSRSKCNGVEGSVPVFHEVEVGEEDFCWALPAKRLAGSCVESPGDGVKIVLGVEAQAFALWKVLAQQAVGVFVDAALPGAVGSAK